MINWANSFKYRKFMTKTKPKFDPTMIAHLEATGWKAYYERAWFKMLQILIQMCRKQFHMPLPLAFLGAYYATRAAIAWVPANHDLAVVERFYAKFYRLAGRY